MNLRTVVIMGIMSGLLLCWFVWRLANTIWITLEGGM